MLSASTMKIKIDEVIIDPRAPRSVRLDCFDSSSSKRKRPKRSALDQSKIVFFQKIAQEISL